MNKCLISYFLSGLLGSILFTLVYHFSLKKNSGLCALFAALPIMGLFGIYNINKHNANINKYLLKLLIFYCLYILLFFTIYLTYNKTKKINLAVFIGILIWSLMICFNLN